MNISRQWQSHAHTAGPGAGGWPSSAWLGRSIHQRSDRSPPTRPTANPRAASITSRRWSVLTRPVLEGRAEPMRHGTETINDFRLRGSSRCRCMGEYSTETRLFTWMVHTFDNHNASLRGWHLAAVVRGFPETPHQTRDYTDFPSLMRQSEARLRLVRPPLARPAARRTVGEDGGGSDPLIFAADAPRGRVRLFMPFPCPWGSLPPP